MGQDTGKNRSNRSTVTVTIKRNKMKKQIIASIIFTAAVFNLPAQENMHPSPAQSQTIVIEGGTIHKGNGEIIENGSIVIEKGKIQSIGKAGAVLTGTPMVIKANGKHIYPGLIASSTNLGLVEVASVRATFDYREVGDINPSIRSLVAYNTDSKVINTLRSNGIVLAHIVPQGGTISGTSSVVQLDAWNYEDAAYKIDNGIHLTMPSLINRPSGGRRRGAAEETDNVKLGLEKIADIRSLFKEAKAYNAEKTHAAINLKYEALKGLFDKSQTLFVHCDLVKEMMVAINLAKEFDLKLALIGASESWMITDILKANNVAVILGEPHSLPDTEDDAVDQPYKTGAALQKAGIVFSFCFDGGDGYWQQRNLPYEAGTMAAYGLTKEEALSAITLNAAKILGIDDRTGTIETGKDANIVISEGDILDMKTSIVTDVLIQGRVIDLNNKHKQLFERYQYKYGIGK